MDAAAFHRLTPGQHRDPLDPDHEPSWPDPRKPAVPTMDPERHVAHGFDDEGPRRYKGGSLAFRQVCDCGQAIFGRSVEACDRHALEHLAGKR